MPDLSFSVSQMDVFRAWEQDQDADISWLLKALAGKEETEDMKRGSAFHAAIDKAEGELDCLDSQDFSFIFNGEFECPLFPLREVRGSKSYNGLEVRGRVDGLLGKHILDHKAATWFDAERYFRKYQWRYYLDIFGADKFTWYVWEMQEADEPRVFHVRDLHVIEQYRYPGLEQDCRDLAGRLKIFAENCLPKAVA